MKTTILSLLLLAACALPASAQAMAPEEPRFDEAATGVHQQLEDSLAELTQLREEMAADRLPLSRRLSELEGELVAVKAEYQQTARLLDSRTLDLSNLTAEIQLRRDETGYINSLLGEYIRGFEAGLHIAEIQRYEEALDAAKLAMENRGLSEDEVFAAQTALLGTSVDRLFDALGGTRFEGTAVSGSGLVESGTFAMLGPAALFRAASGAESGMAEQRLGSLEPALVAFADALDSAAAANLVSSADGFFPLDPTLGNAHKIEATQESFIEHVKKGGLVMIPIFAMAAAALLVALFKWLSLAFVRKPSPKQVQGLLAAVADHDLAGAEQCVTKLRGPTGRMLAAGVEHMREPRQLIEEVMYETVLTTRLRLQSFLPFIAICAASAPLLGLLGTVTGIINTFKLITVFGSGDVKSLSGGISEALITTKFGLIVAIPSLLLHAFLSRKAKGVINDMEQAAIAFVNQVTKSAPKDGHEQAGESGLDGGATPGSPLANSAATRAPEQEALRSQVKQVLAELLHPLANGEAGDDLSPAKAARGKS